MSIIGPIKKPTNPISFKPINIAIKVGDGLKPTPLPITFGSNTFLCTSRNTDNTMSFIASAGSPVIYAYKAHGIVTPVAPSIGNKSTRQIIKLNTSAFFGVINNSPINVKNHVIPDKINAKT